MSEHTYWRARSFLNRGEVKLQSVTPNFLFFKIGEHTVKLTRGKEEGTCTCESGSLWNPGGKCSHIEACRMWLRSDQL